ncbi:MAG: methyltransferase domain-containing protein [Betaproteobacteria bacterium]|nr:methyltransferase domain-containing protein [Betaproteobacteria bacterium]
MTLEKERIRRGFNRCALEYANTAVLAREIGKRLFDHFEFLKIQPARILDLGAGTGFAGNDLHRLFPKATLISLDVAHALLRANPWRPRPWWHFGSPDMRASICAEAEQIPLQSGSMGLVWSNLMLPWCSLDLVLNEVRRVLEPEGLFIFSSLGPDSLKELRSAFAQLADGHAHVHDFLDMHDIGDALVHAGFSDPVMDREDLKVTYPDLSALVQDLRRAGGSNALKQRQRGLMGRHRWNILTASYERLRQDGVLPATFEVVYGHAWKPAPRKTSDGRPIIEVRPA